MRAGGKTFFFDVERNDRGVFVRLSEVSNVEGYSVCVPFVQILKFEEGKNGCHDRSQCLFLVPHFTPFLFGCG